jgi:hypothetical protein
MVTAAWPIGPAKYGLLILLHEEPQHEMYIFIYVLFFIIFIISRTPDNESVHEASDLTDKR